MPTADERNTFWLTWLLVAANIGVFIAQLIQPDITAQYAASYASIITAGQYENILISGFLHASISHLGWNMVFLFLIGRICEDVFGTLQTAAIYTVGLIGAALAFILVFPELPAVGASGAIFGLIGAAMLGAPERSVFEELRYLRVLAVPLIRNFSSAVVLGTLFVIPNVLNAFSTAGNIAYLAHVAGAVIGAGLAYVFRPEHARKGVWAFSGFAALMLVLLLWPTEQIKAYAAIGIVLYAVFLRAILWLV